MLVRVPSAILIISCFNKRSTVCSGSDKCTGSGRLRIRNWTDKDGNKRRNAEVEADSVYFGDSKKSSEGNSTDQSNYGSQASQNPYAETEALIAKYTSHGAQQSDFAMLEDNDPSLPF